MQRRILITGANGLIGRYLKAHFTAAGDEVKVLRRTRSQAGSLHWDAGLTALDPAIVSGFDVVIHLSGEPVIGRWTQSKKKRIYESRLRSTSALATAIVGAARPPSVFLSASAIGFYGFRGNHVVDESFGPSAGFLTGVCRDWEHAARKAAEVSRVIPMRLGIVLSPDGGILGSLLPLYRLGLGGAPGDGKQLVSWIAITDVANAIEHLLKREELAGPVNFVSPEPVTAQELSDWIGKMVRRPAWVRQPAWLLRAAMGRDAADETLLGSLGVRPLRLLETGFQYRCPSLPAAFSDLNN